MKKKKSRQQSYFDRKKLLGWTRWNTVIPKELVPQLLAYKQQLLADYEKTSTN